jgi:hypothetical protein
MARQPENIEMLENKKVTVKEIRQATEVLMRLLEEYQAVNPQNADATVEYEEKMQSITSLFAIKRYDGLTMYSLLDLLTDPVRNQACPGDGHQLVCINHDFVLGEDNSVGFAQDHVCRPMCTECGCPQP